MTRPSTPLLDTITDTKDVRALPEASLRQLADELRADVISAVAQTGGHLGAGLGVIELTVALHHVYDTPRDRVIWDVGHQAYPHKILTGRRGEITTLRQEGACLVLPNGLNLIMILSALVTPRPLFQLVLAWRLPAILMAGTIM